MNITPVFNQVLAGHNAQPVEPYVFRLENLDEFLKEAYRIRTHIAKLHTDLKSIRQRYLSTVPPPRRKQNAAADKDSKYLTDAQRNEIDAQARQSLRELRNAINVLREAEGVRQSTISQLAMRKRAKQGLGALGRWAAGGAITAKSPEEDLEEARVKTIQAHRESILWSLQSTLAKCGQYQSSMMEIRLQREVEKSKSVLYKTRTTMPSSEHGGMDGGSSVDRALQDYRGTSSHAQDESAAIEQQLDPEQLQLFAQENQDMLKQYEDQLDKVRAAEKSLLEVSELQSTLSSHLEIQSAHIEQLVEDSFATTENIGSGNKELKKATERKSTAQKVFYGTTAFCTFLILWDLFI